MTVTRSGRSSRLRKAIVLVPLAALSAAWTVSLVGGPSVTLAADQTRAKLPDGTSVPSEAIQAPASVTVGDSLGLGIGTADTEQIVSTSTTSGIPSAALSAYQRAETVMNAADQSCHLPWQLVAAIGRVESNHGRANGNVLNDQGIATPGIYGVQLDGTNGTQSIVDSDAGQYDNDTSFDRAVGPMQFLPSTWSVVGVDADGDGARNPQDINDAALATAVYLCSGDDDLSTTAGQQAAVYRYNHSQSYVALVLAIMQAYLNGDFTSIPNGTVMAGELGRYQGSAPAATTAQPSPSATFHVKTRPTSSATATASASPTTQPSQQPSQQPTQQPSQQPTQQPSIKATPKPTKAPTVRPTVSVSVPPVPSTNVTPIDQALTLVQATAQCTQDGINQVLNPTQFQACLDKYMHPNG